MGKSITNVNESSLKNCPQPEWTNSWRPFPHHQVVDLVRSAIKKTDLEVISARYDLNVKGTQMFATWGIMGPGGDTGTHFQLGFRNAVDKQFALGFCAGINVRVCSNLCFSGDYITFRKHTGCLEPEEIEIVAGKALMILPKEKEVFDTRFNNYREHPVNDELLKPVVYDLMKNGALPPSKFEKFHKCLEEEAQMEKARTLASVHNGVTRLFRNGSIRTISAVTPPLTQVTDDYLVRLAA